MPPPPLGGAKITKIGFLQLVPDDPSMAINHPDGIGLVVWWGLAHAFCRRVPQTTFSRVLGRRMARDSHGDPPYLTLSNLVEDND